MGKKSGKRIFWEEMRVIYEKDCKVKKEYEQEIDEMVYKLYSLSEEKFEILEKFR